MLHTYLLVTYLHGKSHFVTKSKLLTQIFLKYFMSNLLSLQMNISQLILHSESRAIMNYDKRKLKVALVALKVRNVYEKT